MKNSIIDDHSYAKSNHHSLSDPMPYARNNDEHDFHNNLLVLFQSHLSLCSLLGYFKSQAMIKNCNF